MLENVVCEMLFIASRPQWVKLDDMSNMLNMQHIIPNLKRWDYSDIPGGGRK